MPTLEQSTFSYRETLDLKNFVAKNLISARSSVVANSVLVVCLLVDSLDN